MTNQRPFFQTMITEAEAIMARAQSMSQHETTCAVELLVACTGKVLVTGVGKSGLVAQKFAASLTSVGLMSVYLNPLDALHGDIGVVRDGDVIVLISNSGETSELLTIIPHLKKRSITLLGILGQTISSLGARCDVVLDASVESEASQIDQVPTSSTAVAMAICDGLMVEWMTAKGVSAQDFAMNHPAGAIGRRLTMSVHDLMIPREKLLMISVEATLLEVVDALTTQAIGAVLVAPPRNAHALGGVITDGDLRRALKRTPANQWGTLIAKDLMTSAPISVSSGTLAVEALTLMERNARKAISVLPVIDAEKVVGMLRMHDLVQAGLW